MLEHYSKWRQVFKPYIVWLDYRSRVLLLSSVFSPENILLTVLLFYKF